MCSCVVNPTYELEPWGQFDTIIFPSRCLFFNFLKNPFLICWASSLAGCLGAVEVCESNNFEGRTQESSTGSITVNALWTTRRIFQKSVMFPSFLHCLQRERKQLLLGINLLPLQWRLFRSKCISDWVIILLPFNGVGRRRIAFCFLFMGFSKIVVGWPMIWITIILFVLERAK